MYKINGLLIVIPLSSEQSLSETLVKCHERITIFIFSRMIVIACYQQV